MRYLAEKFPDNIKLYVGEKGGNILAGAVIFENKHIVHVQYMANSDEGRETGALDAVIDNLITNIYKDRMYLDFGMSNEDGGWFLNEGLIGQKEGFGGRSITYDFYCIRIGDSKDG